MENNNVNNKEEKEKNEDQERFALIREKEGLSAFGAEVALRAPTNSKFLYYLAFAKGILTTLILVILLIFSLESLFLFGDIRKFITENSIKTSNTIGNIESASKALEQSSKAVQEVSEAQNKILTNAKTQENIALLLRQADDLARLVKNANIALNQVNREILPSANKALEASTNTINQAGSTLRQTETTIRVLTAKGEIILDSSNASIRALEAILANPSMKSIVENIASTANHSSETIKDLDVSVKEVNKAIPELLASIKAISNNTDLSGKEVTKFLEGLNKPQTKKQRLSKFLLETIIKSSPVLLKR